MNKNKQKKEEDARRALDTVRMVESEYLDYISNHPPPTYDNYHPMLPNSTSIGGGANMSRKHHSRGKTHYTAAKNVQGTGHLQQSFHIPPRM